ncbi:hypothetical protein K438DRAFT_1972381 [Mycena galopus ATCC 62051]|nr:hypothetical protein K438DRAFT_1972381 [Mycena galopus ATCC 62051]
MSSNTSVVVLHHDPTPEILIPRYDDLTTELEESAQNPPLRRPGGADVPVLEEFLCDECNGVLKVWLTHEGLPDITEKGDLRSGSHNTFQRTDVKQVQVEEGDVLVAETTVAATAEEDLGEVVVEERRRQGDRNDPPAAAGFPAGAQDFQWQLNPKLNVSIMPVWDSKDELIIDYVINMASLALPTFLMAVHVVQMAPMKFTGRL